jgi:hypothetical protein
MSIRTAEQLDDALADDLIWRKKEMSVLKWEVEKANSDKRDALIRAGVALLYAHWEGFTKTAGSSYLQLVAFKRLKNAELAIPFLTISARKLLRSSSETSRITAHLAVTRFFLNHQEDQSSIAYKDAFSTEGNLSSKVLREILDTLGIDYSPYEMKAQLIDVGLLKSRNTIAHGEYLAIDEPRYHQLSDEVIGMLDTLRNQISNAAAKEEFRRVA